MNVFHHIYFILKYTFNLNSIFNIWIILKLNNSCWPVRPCNVSCIHRKCALGPSWQLCSLNFNQSAQQHHFCLSFHYRSNLNKEWGHGWLCYTFIWHFPICPSNPVTCQSITAYVNPFTPEPQMPCVYMTHQRSLKGTLRILWCDLPWA